MRRSARGARSSGGSLLQSQDALDLTQLSIRILEGGSTLHDQIDADAVADGHLVDKPPQIELKLGDPGVELITPTLKIDGFATSSVEAGGAERRRSGRAPGVRRLISRK